LRLKGETAAEISGVNDLLENRFLVVSEDYVRWVDAEEEREFSKAEPGLEVGPLAGALLRSRRRERARTLRMAVRMGALEHTVLDYERQKKTETKRRARETQRLEQRAQGRDQDLQRCKRRARRLAQRNDSLELQLENVVGSRGWRMEQGLRNLVARLGRRRRR
jgi:cell division septum initiation protein DivIVA